MCSPRTTPLRGPRASGPSPRVPSPRVRSPRVRSPTRRSDIGVTERIINGHTVVQAAILAIVEDFTAGSGD